MAKVETERYFGKKGIIIMIRDGNKMVSAIFKDKKNADKFNRNNPSDIKKLLQLAKKTKFPKAIDEASIKGQNRKTGENFGMVIGSDKKNREGNFELTIRVMYSSRISAYKLTFNSNNELINVLDYGYSMDGRPPDVKGSGSGKSVKLDKRKTITFIAKLTSPAFASKIYKHLQKVNESLYEGYFSTIDQIRKDSKNVRDFVKNVFADRDFKKMKNDKEFIKYLKSIYEDIDVGHEDNEPSMLKATAYEIMEYGKKLMDKLEKYDDMEEEVDFPGWWQSKLTLAKDYVQKAYHYLDSKEKLDGEGPKDEGFASDAQRRAAFASGYKAKGKKGKKKKNESVNEALTIGRMAKKYKNRDRFISAFFAHMKKHYGDSFKDFSKDKKYRDTIGKAWDREHGVDESVKEGSMSWEKHFKGYNEKELKVISKFIFMNPQGIDGVIKMSKHKPKDFKKTIQRAAKAGLHEGKKRYNVMYGVGSSKYTVNFHDGKSKHKDGSDFFDIAIFKNKRDLAKKINDLTKKGYIYSYTEGVNEASKEAMGIAGFTGTRGVAVDDFIKKNNIDARKLFNFVKKGNLRDRMDFVTAIAGKPNNKFFKMIVGRFAESVNENKNKESKVIQVMYKYAKTEKKFYDKLADHERRLGQRQYQMFIGRALQGFGLKNFRVKSIPDAEEKLYQTVSK